MKRTLMVLALMAIMFGMAAATETRVATFGPASIFVDDYTDIYFLPAAALSYPRLIAAEMGNSFPVTSDYGWTYGSAAVLFSNAEQTYGVVGLDINHEILGADFFNDAINNINTSNALPALSPMGYDLVVPAPDNRFHMFYARKMDKLGLGLHVGWAGSSSSYDYSDTITATATEKGEGSSSIWDINGNVAMEVNENTSADLAFSLKMQSFSSKYDYTWPTPPQDGATIESDGGMGLDIGLRASYGMADNFALIPVIGISMNSVAYKTSYVDTAIHAEGGKTSSFGFSGAFGGNYKPAENVTIVGGLLVSQYTETIEDTMGVFGVGVNTEENSTFTFPGFCAGLEVDLLKWLTLRAGAAKLLQSNSGKYETTAATTEYSSTDAPYFYAFGLGFKFGKLAIDTKVNNNAPYSLGYMFSGIDNGGMAGVSHTEPITSIGMTYTF
ncbi:hypothetical protein HZA73_00045 [candidate division TA06 bacterium]|nr:hypothetical protein [candidate division TA06 bacterium]